MKSINYENIALFGTSADPPTIGHQKILEELAKIFNHTITYVSNNPQKRHKADISDRSLLLKTLIKDLNNPRIIFNQKISSQWAIESIKNCKNLYKVNNLDFVIGSDLIPQIFSWKNFNEIINESNLFIIERKGYPVKTNTLKKLSSFKVNFKIATLNIPNISSSMVRLKTDYSDLPKSLIDIVRDNNLYLFAKEVE